ncbi:MAG: helicase-related protein, partial [archaeon]
MKKVLKIPDSQSDPVLNIIEDTLNKKKQAIVFVNTKRGAESQAEKIASKIKTTDEKLNKLSEEILKALPSPTRQCRRLAMCIKKGSAFHHAGLATKQREIIEDGFREGLVRVISCTPSLALGVDLPAFRVIVRDLKRYGGSWGMQDIPVLEYEQQAGRAGRPGKEDYGEAICIAKTDAEKNQIFKKYVNGESEEIYSKLAVEPVLRAHILSLIASEFVVDRESLFEFFDNTFYAHQYEDLAKLHNVLEKITGLLEEWEFIKVSGKEDFVSADSLGEEAYQATMIGSRISELYLDPLTANFIINCLKRATAKKTRPFSYLQMVARTLEIRPLLRVKVVEYEDIQSKMLQYESSLIDIIPTEFDQEYDEFLNSIKTSLFFQDWIEEKNEDDLLELFSITPGEVHAKLAIADWLLYSTVELARMLSFQPLMNDISKVRLRLKYGAKEELLPLLKLKNIGRVRA